MLKSNEVNATFQWIDCDLSVPISGATSATYIAKKSGSYAVEITKNGCSKSSDCINVTLVGLNLGSLDQDRLLIYPNPARTSLYISFKDPVTSITEITILNQHGQNVLPDFKLVKSGMIERLDISSLDRGIYLIRIKSDHCVINRRLVIE